MLLGCCHCEDTPSSSSGSSSSGGSSSSAISTAVGCSFCSGGIAPLRYKAVITGGSGGSNCIQKYKGTYILTLDQTGGTCYWKSSELAVDYFNTGGGCPDKVGVGFYNRRWYMTQENYVSGFNVRLTAGIWNGSDFVPVNGLVGTQGSPTSVRNCLTGWSGSATIGGLLLTAVVTVVP